MSAGVGAAGAADTTGVGATTAAATDTDGAGASTGLAGGACGVTTAESEINATELFEVAGACGVDGNEATDCRVRVRVGDEPDDEDDEEDEVDSVELLTEEMKPEAPVVVPIKCVLRCDIGEGAASDELAVRSPLDVECAVVGAGGCGAAPGGGAGVGRAGRDTLRSSGRSGSAGVPGMSSSSSSRAAVASAAGTRA